MKINRPDAPIGALGTHWHVVVVLVLALAATGFVAALSGW